MGQTFYSDSYDGSNDVQSDLGHMETNFETLRSMFSGSSAPSSPTPVAYQPWMDTTQLVLKYRDPGDTTWWGLFHGDTSQKVYIWRNAAMDGWAVDSGVSDRVLAVKGGSIYTTGAAAAGTWTAPSALDHVHQWYESNQTSAADETWDEDGDPTVTVPDLSSIADGLAPIIPTTIPPGAKGMPDSYTDEWSASGASGWRPAAYVGTMQYLDL